MVPRQRVQPLGQFHCSSAAQLRKSGIRVREPRRGCLPDSSPLARDPGLLLFGKELGMASGSPPRKSDADRTIGTHAEEIPSSRGVLNEFHETITIVRRHGPE